MNADSTVVNENIQYAIEHLEKYANMIGDKIQEVAPVAYEMVRSRIIAESIAWVVVPFILTIIFSVACYIMVRKSKDSYDEILGVSSVIIGVCAFAAFGFLVGGGVVAFLDLTALDYATVARIMMLAN